MIISAPSAWVDRTFGWFFAPSASIRADFYYGIYKTASEPAGITYTRAIPEISESIISRRTGFTPETAPIPTEY